MSIAESAASAAPVTQRPAAGTKAPITLAMFDRMIAAGVFAPPEDHPLELIEGELMMMSPIGDQHADAVDWLARWSQLAIPAEDLLVRIQNPLELPSSTSVPQPDIAWVTLRRYVDRRPRPEDVSLVIEVADTSLEFDTGTKASLYAAAGIADYWVVDLASRAVIVFRDPRCGRYETRSTFRDHATISPLALPTARLLPADLFPA